MILSWRYHYSLNNDYHYHYLYNCRYHYMQGFDVYFILSCLVFSWFGLTSITIVIIGMTLYELVLHYHIISYHIIPYHLFSNLICSALYFIQLDSTWLYSILFDLSYCSVLHLISMNDLCLFVLLSVRSSVCLLFC